MSIEKLPYKIDRPSKEEIMYQEYVKLREEYTLKSQFNDPKINEHFKAGFIAGLRFYSSLQAGDK